MIAQRLAIAVALAAPAARAETVEDFYRGKTIQLRVGVAAGSGYDIAARLMAPFLARHLPGHPSVIVQNVPGAGSALLANQLYAAAPRDGSVIGMVTNGVPTAPMLTPDTARFEIARFGWIGSPAPETMLVIAWRDAPVRAIGDLFDKEFIVGAVSPGTATVDNPLVANAALGTKFRIAAGYESPSAIDLAMARGEVQGQGGIGWVTVKARDKALVERGDIRIIAQYGFRKHPDLPDTPLFDQPTDEAKRQQYFAIVARQEFGRPLLAPPGVPAERLAALRAAFDAAMHDPDLLAQAERAKMEINPVSGATLETLAAQIESIRPDVVADLRRILDPGQSNR